MASAELYDSRSATWTATGSMREARAGHTATLLRDGTVLIAGGGSSPADTLASAEIYVPSTGTWTATGRMHEARASHTATLLADGNVLVARRGRRHQLLRDRGLRGALRPERAVLDRHREDARRADTSDGHAAGGRQRARCPAVRAARTPHWPPTELYDPRTGSWAAASNMITGRAGHTATLQPDGRVLVAGGVSGGFTGDLTPSDILASAELYDPAKRSWTATGAWSHPRFNSVAVGLMDGRVLVAAGDTLGAGPLTAAELYDPAAGRGPRTAPMIEGRAATTRPWRYLTAGSSWREAKAPAPGLRDPDAGRSW